VVGTTVAMHRVYTLMAQQLSQYTTILKELEKFQLGVDVNAMLTPILIDKVKLQQVLHTVRGYLVNRYPRTYLLWNRVADVYGAHNFVYGRRNQHLLVQMHLPLTLNQGHYFCTRSRRSQLQ